MNYKKIVLLVVSVCSVAIQPLNAYIKSINIWRVPRKGGGFVRVLVLGDVHGSVPFTKDRELDTQHKQIVAKALEEWKSENITFVLESNEAEFQAGERALALIGSDDPALAYVELLHALRQISHKHSYCYGTIDFKWEDLRTDPIRYFLDAVEALNGKAGEEKAEGLRVLKMVNAPVSAGACVEEWRKHIDYLKAFTASCEQPKTKEKVDCYLSELEINHKEFAKYVDAVLENRREPVENILLKSEEYEKTRFKREALSGNLKCESIAGFKREYSDRIEQMSKKLSSINKVLFWDLADAGFLAAFEKYRNNTSNMVLFLGDGHAFGINKYLKEIGATLVKQVGAQERFQLNVHVANQDLKALLATAFRHTDLQLMERIGQIGACRVCQKSTDQMKKCGACKVTKYCSAECQKKDWKEHRLVCASRASSQGSGQSKK